MGFLNSIFGGGATDAARRARNEGGYTPYNLSLPGASIGYVNPTLDKKGRITSPGSVSASMSPEMQQQYGLLGGAFQNALYGAQGGVPGYQGIPGQVFNEFGLANYATDQLGVPWRDIGNIGNYYAPDLPDTAMQGFLGASDHFTNAAQNMPTFDINAETQRQLEAMRAADAPAEMKGMMANWDNQFGKGIMSSTPGQYQSQALMDSYQTKDLQRQMGAYQNALAGGGLQLQQQGLLGNLGLGYGSAAGDLGNMLYNNQLSGQGFLANLDAQRSGINANQFGIDLASNQLGGQRVQDRFARAMGLFGAGQEASTNQANQALGYLGGQGGIDSYLANLMGLGGNLGTQRSAATMNAYAPLISARAGQDAAYGGFFSGMLQSIGQGMQGPSGGGGEGGGFDFASMLSSFGGGG